MVNKKSEKEAPETPEVVDEKAKTAESESTSELETASEVDSTEASEGKTEESEKTQINADVLQNIPVTISVEVGRTKLKIRDLMRLTQGSVVELDRLAGEPLDLLVNNTLVAQGEVVLVNERYGVRLTSVVPTADRVKNL